MIIVEGFTALFADGLCLRITLAGIENGLLRLVLGQEGPECAPATPERTEAVCAWVDGVVQGYLTRHGLTLNGWRTFNRKQGWRTVTLSPGEPA